ncbi:MAG TPA: CpsB/CapC family capsule biosynthesis tyrosine phosphatase [Candidatus Acidoferrales bacterium]|nr:CpsB/CapC family capsule biosynthesis tyrosine phosphatase [Candidatus Acidoferrales bacterium]
MVDIHCHILAGLDDGPKNFEQSVAMAEMAIADGITHVVATPHANAEFRFQPDMIRERAAELQLRFKGKLALATGCDFHLSVENLRDFHALPSKYTINQKCYLLVEFSDFSIPPNTDEVLHGIRLAGVFPIVTHPERNSLIRNRPEMLWKWMRMGCFVQITAQSLLGKFGPKAEAAAKEWLDQDRMHFVASDAHDAQKRPLKLKTAYDLVATRRGQAIAGALLRENPLAAFEGRPLPYQPEAPPEQNEAHLPKKKRFGIF